MSEKSIRNSRFIDAHSQQTRRRSLRLLSSETIGKVSSLQLVDDMESVEMHPGNLSEMPMKSDMKSRPRIGTQQTLLQRSTRFLQPEKLKPEISSLNSNFCMESVEIHPDSLSITSQSKETASSRNIRAAIHGKSQLKLSGSKSGAVLEERQSGLRRSLRLSSQTGRKVFEIPQGFPDGNQRRQSRRLLGLAPVTAEHVRERIENRKASHEVEHNKPFKVDCKLVATRRTMESVSATTRARKEWNQPETIAESNPEIVPQKEVVSTRRSMELVSVTSRVRKEWKKQEAIADSKPEMVPRKECKPLSSQIRRSSPRFMSASNGVMKREATMKMPDKVEVVAERLNAECRDLVLERGREDAFVITKKADLQNAKRTKMEEHEVEDGIEKKKNEECCGTGAWNNEQEETLKKAYLIAKPSPNFWKKVSRMVPGKSAQECFDKIHASIATPLSSQPRPRIEKKSPSPIANFNFSANILPQVSQIEAGRLRRCRAKKLAAQKTVRHLLRKHRLADQTKPADHFSLLESSPIKIALNNTSTSPFLSQQSGEKFSANSKMFSRFKLLTSPDGPSPQVLKQIKNRALHDRYIDQLHQREARRVMLAKKSKFDYLGNSKCFSKLKHGALKAARTALISDAKSFIRHFQRSAANPMDDLDTDCSDEEDDNDDDIDVGDLDE